MRDSLPLILLNSGLEVLLNSIVVGDGLEVRLSLEGDFLVGVGSSVSGGEGSGVGRDVLDSRRMRKGKTRRVSLVPRKKRDGAESRTEESSEANCLSLGSVHPER